MSGYLMDKLYGNLIPSEEYLRASIEDVYSMLIRAIKKSPENPISRYNMARYFINSANKENENFRTNGYCRKKSGICSGYGIKL